LNCDVEKIAAGKKVTRLPEITELGEKRHKLGSSKTCTYESSDVVKFYARYEYHVFCAGDEQ
jgi:hypothetical protein